MTLPYIFFNFHEQIFLKIADNPDKFFENFLITQPDFFIFDNRIGTAAHEEEQRSNFKFRITPALCQ